MRTGAATRTRPPTRT